MPLTERRMRWEAMMVETFAPAPSSAGFADFVDALQRTHLDKVASEPLIGKRRHCFASLRQMPSAVSLVTIYEYAIEHSAARLEWRTRISIGTAPFPFPDRTPPGPTITDDLVADDALDLATQARSRARRARGSRRLTASPAGRHRNSH